ncbi:MAG TPA: COX15/CtaA family protein [Bacteroidia bacterium]
MNYIKINRRFGILTISSVFLLLIAGGVVRSTGSGMGCPDWPKCYGAYFPPTCACKLPANYQEIYVQQRLKKAEKFAKMLRGLGMSKQADLLMNDPELRKPEVFNKYKAWTEYINRLIGVLSGLFSLVFFVTIFYIRKHISKFKFWTGILGFIMMIFNAWLGSIVVATNLFPIMISIHYLAAYAVLALMMFSIINVNVSESSQSLIQYKWYFIGFVVLSLIQLIYGTQLREISDKGIAEGKLYLEDGVNMEFLGSIFKTHWFMAIVLILISLVPPFLLRKKVEVKWLKLMLSITGVLVLQYISGVLNLRYNFPLVAQVSHIFFAGIIFGITLYICIAIFRSSKNLATID